MHTKLAFLEEKHTQSHSLQTVIEQFSQTSSTRANAYNDNGAIKKLIMAGKAGAATSEKRGKRREGSRLSSHWTRPQYLPSD